MKKIIFPMATWFLFVGFCFTADTTRSDPAANVKALLEAFPATEENIAYGKHPKQVMCFWKAVSKQPAPLIFYIHGGGWYGGDRSEVKGVLKSALADGISVVSIEYRNIPESTTDKLVPPVKGPMFDCARALQFVRSKAKDWNIDKTRIAASGASAGACTSLWLAFHDDLADPKSSDPIARESSRLLCAAVNRAQTSLDPQQMREWTPNITYGGHAFGIGGFDAFFAAREQLIPFIKEYSPWALVSSNDPPIGLYYTTAPEIGKEQKDPTHHANFGIKLKEQCVAMKVPCELVYPGATAVQHPLIYDFLRAHLKP